MFTAAEKLCKGRQLSSSCCRTGSAPAAACLAASVIKRHISKCCICPPDAKGFAAAR